LILAKALHAAHLPVIISLGFVPLRFYQQVHSLQFQFHFIPALSSGANSRGTSIATTAVQYISGVKTEHLQNLLTGTCKILLSSLPLLILSCSFDAENTGLGFRGCFILCSSRNAPYLVVVQQTSAHVHACNIDAEPPT
jgi:hypothetical protein